jgi:hypothetical protein
VCALIVEFYGGNAVPDLLSTKRDVAAVNDSVDSNVLAEV